MKKIKKNLKKIIISAIALILVVLMFIGVLTSCGKPDYFKEIEKAFSIHEGSYTLSVNLNSYEVMTDEIKSSNNSDDVSLMKTVATTKDETNDINNVELLLSGKIKINGEKTLLTTNVKANLSKSDKAIDITDVLLNKKGIYINIGKMVNAIKNNILNNSNSFYTKIFDKIKIPEDRFLFFSYQEIEEESSLNKEDANTIITAFNDTFVKDIKDFLTDTGMISRENNEVIIKLNNENAEKIIKKFREYIKEKFELTYTTFLSKIKDINTDEVTEEIKTIKQAIVDFSNNELNDYEKDYDETLKEKNIEKFNFVSKVNNSNKKSTIAFTANSVIDNKYNELNAKYTIQEEKIEDDFFAIPENIISLEEIQAEISKYFKQN